MVAFVSASSNSGVRAKVTRWWVIECKVHSPESQSDELTLMEKLLAKRHVLCDERMVEEKKAKS